MDTEYYGLSHLLDLFLFVAEEDGPSTSAVSLWVPFHEPVPQQQQ